MNAPDMGQRAVNGAERTTNLTVDRQKLSSSEMSIDNASLSGCPPRQNSFASIDFKEWGR